MLLNFSGDEVGGARTSVKTGGAPWEPHCSPSITRAKPGIRPLNATVFLIQCKVFIALL